MQDAHEISATLLMNEWMNEWMDGCVGHVVCVEEKDC